MSDRYGSVWCGRLLQKRTLAEGPQCEWIDIVEPTRNAATEVRAGECVN